ncbi:MAG: ECF-type sigma factor [Gemmatimonadales bacterium]
MPDPTDHEVTRLLADLSEGVPDAADRLAPIVYHELHRLATFAMQRESAGHTLQPTELVHEAFIRLVGQRDTRWANRSQFYGIASQAIRRILIDHARRRRAAKRDHGIRVTLDERIGASDERELDLIALDEALTQLEALDPRQARVVELRFFAGLSVEETATALDISPATVKRDWTFARAFLLRALDDAPPETR